MRQQPWIPLACLLGLALSPSAQAQTPNIAAGGVLSPAGFIFNGLPNWGIARGSLFRAYFANRIAALPTRTVSLGQFPLQTTLNGVSMRVTVGSTTANVFVYAVSPDFVDGLLPSSVPAGDGTLVVTVNGVAGQPAPIRVLERGWNNFTIPQNGSGPGIVTRTNFEVLTPTSSANPGEAVILWGTGAGPVTGPEGAAPQPGNLSTSGVEVLIGNQPAPIIGLSRSSQFAGLDQLAVFVPNNVSGCYVSVTVRIGNIVSNSFTMPVAARGRICSDENGFSEADLNLLNSQGFLRIGVVNLDRTALRFSLSGFGTFDATTDSGDAEFYRFDRATFAASRGLDVISVGSCQVLQFRGDDAESPDPFRTLNLNAGPLMNVIGPLGTRTMRRQDGVYSGEFGGGIPFPGGPAPAPLFLNPDNFTINNGAGGPDVGAFSYVQRVPPPLNWTNRDQTESITRTNGLRVTWTGGDPGSFVEIFGYSVRENPDVGALFVCVAPVSAGQFTVPSSVLLQLPASQGDFSGLISVGTTSRITRFNAPGLDVGHSTASSASARTVIVF